MKVKLNEEINRGDIYWCCPRNCDSGKRLYVVVSNDAACKHSDTILMCPLTTRRKKELPTHVILRNVNNRTATVTCENIVPINKADIMDYVLTLDSKEMKKLNVAIYIAVGL